MAELKSRKQFMKIEFEIETPDLTDEESLYIFSDDLGDMISAMVHDLNPDPEQASKIFEWLKLKMHECELFADTDFGELLNTQEADNETKV